MWMIHEWHDGFRYCAQFRDMVFQGRTANEAFQQAYDAKCLAAGV